MQGSMSYNKQGNTWYIINREIPGFLFSRIPLFVIKVLFRALKVSLNFYRISKAKLFEINEDQVILTISTY